MALEDIKSLPIGRHAAAVSHLYLWVPNALLAEGLQVMAAWGFVYKTHLVWLKVRKDGGPDGRGVGFYFRNVTEVVLFGVRGKHARTLAPARRQVNFLSSRKREHSRKPDDLYRIIESCSPGPYLELFARHRRVGWASSGDQLPGHSRAGVHCHDPRRTSGPFLGGNAQLKVKLQAPDRGVSPAISPRN
jgi:N6-adenosine-specific RNA methylase IME4